jgi:hypothetical protein
MEQPVLTCSRLIVSSSLCVGRVQALLNDPYLLQNERLDRILVEKGQSDEQGDQLHSAIQPHRTSSTDCSHTVTCCVM